MSKFKRHVFICCNRRPDDRPRGCCAGKGAAAIRAAFKNALVHRGLKGTIRANEAGCLDQCEHGPTLVAYLRADGYAVVEAGDALELITSLDRLGRLRRHGRSLSVDAVVTDVRLPGMTGLDLLDEFHRYDAHLPVVLITAFGDDWMHREAARRGAVAVFDKPFDMDTLLEFLRDFLPKHLPRPDVGRPATDQ